MPEKILVVDDEADVRTLTKMMLEGAGYKVVQASNGDEALAMVATEAPDLVLLDVVMPGKSGFEVCKTLKAGEKTKGIPVIIFTVLGREVDFRLSMESGADKFLSKPLKPEGMSNLVKEIRAQLNKAKGQATPS
jgi:two-component system alkaline phosphatase synthesis response regulator PhoP